MKTIIKKQQQKNQQTNSKQNQKLNQVNPKGKPSAANGVELDEVPEQLSAYDSYYRQLSEEVETIELYVRELRQIPGLEHLSEAEAQAKVDFMLRFSVWVLNQNQQEQPIAITADEDEIESTSAIISKVQKPKGQRNKKVTKSLSL